MVLGEIVGWEILVPLVLFALLFGSAKLPELARSLGRARHEYARGLRDGTGADAGQSAGSDGSGSDRTGTESV
jgi:TatA/E family protein of Tat protein translocase